LYYEKIIDPISLNDINHRLESDTSYTSLIDVLKDMKKVFTNGKLYYSVSIVDIQHFLSLFILNNLISLKINVFL